MRSENDSSRQKLAAQPRTLLAQVVGISLPTALGNSFEYLPVCFAMAIVGHLDEGKHGLDALSLGRAWFNFTALAPSFGLLSGLRTLCPQAVGAGKPELCRLYTQRACVVLFAASPLCVSLQFVCGPALRYMGHTAELADAAQAYTLRLIPMYFGVGFMTILQRVYQAHDLVWSNMVICGVVCAAAPLLQWGLVRGAGLGVLGAAWAASAFNGLYCFFQVPHLCYLGYGYLFSPSAGALDPAGFREYLAISSWGCLQTVLEWWVLEAVIFAISMIDEAEVQGVIAASAIFGNMQAVFIMAWVGLLVAAASLVGKS